MSDVAIIIPARFASSRYPGKPLAVLKGASGVSRTLLERTVSAGRRVAQLSGEDIPVFVTTDDARVADEARRIGVDVIMTSGSCRNGTERVAEAVELADLSSEIIINLQGDAPLTPPAFVTALINTMRVDDSVEISTPVLLCDQVSTRNLLADRAAGRVGGTTVVVNRLGQAMYFSKEVIPYLPTHAEASVGQVYHHVGLYAYRKPALRAYRDMEQSILETLEGLEQLRFLEHGKPIKAVEVSAHGAGFWELNNPSDVAVIEKMLSEAGAD